MKVLIGPPGSGKTTRILDAVRARIASGSNRFRLVVPTSTMAQHTRNRLAREGLLVRPSSIVTLSRLIAEILPDRRVVSSAGLLIIVEEVMRRLNPASFKSTMDSPGLPAAIASAIAELAGAGCSPDTWAALGSMRVWTSPMMADLGRIYSEVEAELARRGLSLSPGLLAEASRALSEGALNHCDQFFFDGFFTLSPAELTFLRAIAGSRQITLALPEWPGAAEAQRSLRQAGALEMRLHPLRPAPRVELAAPATIHGEAAEIARRILNLNEQGTSFGQIGIIVRAASSQSDLLTSTLAQFGVPVRSYLAEPLSAHPAAQWLSALAQSVECGWDHEAALRLLRNPAFRCGLSPAIEVFASEAIRLMPSAGIAELMTIASRVPGAEPVRDALGALGASESWNQLPFAPSQWAASLKPLLGLAAPPAGASPESVRISQIRGAAIAALSEALDETAGFLGDEQISFERYWRHAWRFIESAELRVESARRDAVALVDAYEARQWEWPVTFVAGLLEGEFPRRARVDPILSNDLRIRANQAGIALRTREDRSQEERFLFSLALSRATRLTVLTYPRFDSKGELNLPSFALESIQAAPIDPVPVRIRPSRPAPPAPPPAISCPAAMAALRVLHPEHTGTALEQFLQCPFVFFVRKTLLLDDPPSLPAERLDMAQLGSLVHAVIAEWHKLGRGAIDAVFDSHWKRLVARLRIPEGFQREFERLRALRALRHYACDPQIADGFEASFEKPVRIELPSGETVKGRIDRCDVNQAGQCRVIDFKYSRVTKLQRLKQLDDAGALLQLGLYLAAVRDAGLTPAAAAYVPLRSAEKWRFKEDAAEMIDLAIRRADEAVMRILAGDIAPQPVIADVCQYCDLAAACRITEMRRGQTAMPASV